MFKPATSATLLSTLLLAGFAAPAADKPDEILILAARTPIQKIHVGNATTVISRQQIERQQVRYVSELLRQVPGFAVSQTSSRGSQTQVRVRGAEGNHVLVIIDGVRANDPANADEFRWELLSAYNVESIQIIRGPQSALWGSDALAGVVLIETRADYSGPQFSAFAEGGSDSTFNTGISGGTGTDDWSLSYGLSRLDTDGTNASRSGGENDGSDLTTASLGAQLKASENVALNAALRIADSTSEFDPTDFGTGLPTDGNQLSESEQAYAQVGTDISTLNGKLQHRFYVRYLETEREDFTNGAKVSSSEADRTTISYQADIAISRHLLTLAAEHERTTFTQRGDVLALPDGDLDPNQDQAITLNSAIADLQLYATNQLTILASARFDDYSDFDDTLTGRLSASWRLNDATKLRSSIGTGQKIPTFTERFGFFPGQFVGNPNLKPEKSMAFDIGIDQLWLDGRLETEATYFNQDLKDEINGFAFLPGLADPTAVNMPNDSERKGVELGARYGVSAHLEVAANYTYTDSTAPDFAGADVREIRRPRHTGSVSGNYRFAADRANLNIVADYNGTQTDTFFPPFPAVPETINLGNYWLVSVALGYDISEQLHVFVRGNNLLDEDYENIVGFNTPDRQAYAGFRINFGD